MAKGAEQKYEKAQLKKCVQFINFQDVLSAVLEDGKTYSKTEAQTAIQQFLKGKVK